MKTIHSYTFDDSVFGPEIHPSWKFSMLDAACYCSNRENGRTPAASLIIHILSQHKTWEEFVGQEEADKITNDWISDWVLPQGFEEELDRWAIPK